jgi:hypothetical protein
MLRNSALQLVQLLETVSEFVKASGGPQALADVLETVSSLCSAAGGSDALVAMLKAALAIINAYGGADEAHKLMSQLSDMVNAMGGSKAFADAIAQLLRDLMRLISGAGGVDELVRLLLEGPRQVVADSAPNGIPDSKYAANLEVLHSLYQRPPPHPMPWPTFEWRHIVFVQVTCDRFITLPSESALLLWLIKLPEKWQCRLSKARGASCMYVRHGVREQTIALLHHARILRHELKLHTATQIPSHHCSTKYQYREGS